MELNFIRSPVFKFETNCFHVSGVHAVKHRDVHRDCVISNSMSDRRLVKLKLFFYFTIEILVTVVIESVCVNVISYFENKKQDVFMTNLALRHGHPPPSPTPPHENTGSRSWLARSLALILAESPGPQNHRVVYRTRVTEDVNGYRHTHTDTQVKK